MPDQHLDLDSLNELKGIMGDEFSLLVETFTNDSIVRIEGIQEAVKANDPEAIRRAAHSFKGSAGNMAAPRLTALCRSLEEMGYNGIVDGCQEILDDIKDEYAQVKEALEAL